jgi:hypothetical protein
MAIPGSNRPPYRAPCPGTVLCGNGPRYQNAKAREKNIPVFIYDGMVPNWDGCPGEPATIAPYERTNPTFFPPETDNCGTGDITYTQPTGQWYGNCTSDSVIVECGPLTDPASGTAGELFDLTNTAPVSWYQPQVVIKATIVAGGTGYTVGEGLDLAGGMASTYVPPVGQSYNNAAGLIVTSVDGSGGITGVAITSPGSYKTNPSSPNAVTGLTGSGASIGLTFANQTESLTQCKKIGFKNVQARRQWHGQPGFYFNDPTGVYFCPDSGISFDEGDLCTAIPFQAYSNDASQTKYLTASVDITLDTFEFETATGIGAACFSDEYSFSNSVNANSGVVTVNSQSYGCGGAAAYSTLLGNDAAAWIAMFLDWQTNGYGPPESDPSSFSCDEGGFSWDFAEGSITQSGSGSWTIGATSFTATNTFTQSDGVHAEPSFTNTQSVSVSDSEVSYSFSGVVSGDTFPVTCSTSLYVEVTFTLSLSGANDASAVISDITTLLGKWDLTDDASYPWRIDANTSIAPVVSRNEVQNNVSPLFNSFVETATEIDDCVGNDPSNPFYTATFERATNVDPNSFLYDGSILGEPMPAGYQGFFDFRWEDWENNGVIDGLIDFEIFGWGAANQALFGLPLNATQWTNVQEGMQFPGGGWIFYNLNPSVAANGDCFGPGANCPAPGPVLVAQKWAETKVPLPSQNFFRPAGNDRFAFDETQVYAINSVTGSGPGAIINLVDTIHCSGADISDVSGLWGPFQNTDGNWYFWGVTGGGSSVTLNAPVYLLPSNWVSASDDGNAADPSNIFCFGKLRWSTGNPATDPPPILGRAGVTAVAEYSGSPTVTQITTDAIPTLGMIVTSGEFDHIDIYDKTMTLLASNAQVTRLDDSDFTVPVALAIIQNAAWIQSHGAPAYYWDDQFPKGDYVYTTWTYWPRGLYEPTRINGVFFDCNGQVCGDSNTTGCDCSSITCETAAANVLSDFSQEAGCVPFNPCNPAVLCISPNGEAFPNGVTHGFATITLDEEYGSGWQAEFQQAMTDLLYQTPHVPASNPCESETLAWTEDNGTCEADTDTQMFFPHRPLVEARLTLPDGAPALPSGITIGWVSPVTDPSSPDALFPAPSNGPSLGGTVPWTTIDSECACIQGGGRFADVYENQVVTCI